MLHPGAPVADGKCSPPVVCCVSASWSSTSWEGQRERTFLCVCVLQTLLQANAEEGDRQASGSDSRVSGLCLLPRGEAAIVCCSGGRGWYKSARSK